MGWLNFLKRNAYQDFIRTPIRSVHDDPVTEVSALQSTAVFACVRVISETVGWLPLPIYRRTPSGKTKAPDYPLYRLLQNEPNADMTAFTFRETMTSHLLLWGNAYAEIEFNTGGYPVALHILPANKIRPMRTSAGELYYELTLSGGQLKNLAAFRVLHIPGLGYDGTLGYSPIQLAKRSVNLSIAADQFGYEFFKSGTNVGGVVTTPTALSDKAYVRLKDDLQDKYAGLGKSHRLMLLEEGMTFAKNTIPPNDAQFLETRKFQVIDIARLYRVPPHMIGDLDKATFSNIEHQDLSFTKHTMMPYFKRWEQTINNKMIPEQDRATYYAEFLVDGILRGDIKTRYEAYQIAIQNGWLNRDEIRAMENHNEIEDGAGKIYTVNAATIPLNQFLNPAADPADPVDEPAADEGRSCTCAECTTMSSGPSETRSWNKSHKHTMQIRNAHNRTQIAKSYESVFEDATRRVIKRERSDIKRQAEKIMGTRSAQDLIVWVNTFYNGHDEFIRKTMRPAFASLTQAVTSAALGEIKSKQTVDTDKTIDGLVDTFTERHITRNRKTLVTRISNTFEAGGDVLDDMDDFFEQQEESYPRKVAMQETVGASSYIAKVAWVAAGIVLLRWITQGSLTCDFCQEMDGRVVGIEQNFLSNDQVITSKDGQLRVSGPKSHPPLHTGCACTISPE